MILKRLAIGVCIVGLLSIPVILIEIGLGIEPRVSKPVIAAELGNLRLMNLQVNQNVSTVIDIVAKNLPRLETESHGPDRYDRYIEEVATNNGVPPALVKAMIKAESGFNPDAVSRRGAIGLMQIMPLTAKMAGITDPYDPHENIQAGVMYLKYVLDMFKGNEKLAVAAYNSGPRKVKRYRGVPPYKETRRYVRKVFYYYRTYLEL